MTEQRGSRKRKARPPASRVTRNRASSTNLAVDSAHGPVLWALLGLCVMCAGLIVYQWSRGRPDPVVNAVLLSAVAWTAALGITRGGPNRLFLVGSPYFASALALITMAVLQFTGDPLDTRQTNALLGAYLTLPVAYLLFFLLRRPTEALIGAIVTCAVAVTLQATLPPAVAGRFTTGGWVAVMTSIFQGALILLLYAVLRLRSDRELLNAVLQSSRDAVILVSQVPGAEPGRAAHSTTEPSQLTVTLANEAATRTFGFYGGQALSATGSWVDASEFRAQLRRALRSGEDLNLNVTLTTLTGHGWYRVTATPFRGGLVVTLADISDHKEDERRALSLAHTDQLTGLANRRGFEAEAAYRQQAALAAGRSTTLCFLDLDGFKAVNDEHGHDAGDELLEQVADRLRSSVRSFDLVARVGGDEFVVMVSGLEEGDVEAFFERVRSEFRRPFPVEGQLLPIGASLGVAVGWQDVQAAVNAADEAMYRAKQRGGGIEIVRGGD